MISYLQRVDRTAQPPAATPLRADRHWSTDGLVACWPFNDGAGSVAVGLPGPKVTPDRDITAAVTGLAAYRDNAADFTFCGNSYNSTGKLATNIVVDPTEFSVVIRFRKKTLPMAQYWSAIFATEITTENQLSPQLAFTDQGNLMWKFANLFQSTGGVWGASYAKVVPSCNFCDGAWHTAVATFKRDAGTWRSTAWCEGSVETDGGTINQTMPAVNIRFGGSFHAPWNMAEYSGFDGELGLIAYYNRELNTNECAMMAANPFQLFEPAVLIHNRFPTSYTVLASGGAVAGGNVRWPMRITPTGGAVAAPKGEIGLVMRGNRGVVLTATPVKFNMTPTTKRFTMTEV